MGTNQKLTNTIKGRIIKTVQQNDTTLILEFQDGSTMHINMAEATSSVMVRDGAQELEYAD